MAINQPSDNLPLAEVLRAANGLVTAKLIEDWALGGALAAIYYVEPFTTYYADIFFFPSDKGLIAGMPAIYAHLQAQGWQVEREHLLVHGFPVQFLAAHGLTEEAVREAERIDYEGVPAKVFRARAHRGHRRQRGSGQGQGAHRTNAPAGRHRHNKVGEHPATA